MIKLKKNKNMYLVIQALACNKCVFVFWRY